MQELVEEKKNGKFVKVVKALAVIGVIYGAFVALTRYMSKKSKEMEQNNIGQKSKNYLSFMNGRNIRISKEQVEDITITAFMGGVDLNLEDAYITKDMDITIKAAMSGIHITVPPMTRVVLDGTNIMSGFANMVPEYESEELPTIFICANSVMSGVMVEMTKEDEE